MKKEKKLELLLKARNILHKQESGEKLTGNEIIAAHDYVDMVLDALVEEQFRAKHQKETVNEEQTAFEEECYEALSSVGNIDFNY